MANIGLIRLAPGEVGFFDELTRIHLTISNPERYIKSEMNTTNIKRSVRSGRLLLVSGSLDPEVKEEAAKAAAAESLLKAKEAEKKAEAEKLAKAKAEEEALKIAAAEAEAKAAAELKAKEEAEKAAKEAEEATMVEAEVEAVVEAAEVIVEEVEVKKPATSRKSSAKKK